MVSLLTLLGDDSPVSISLQEGSSPSPGRRAVICGSTVEAKGLTANGKAIHGLAPIAVTDRDPQKIAAFQKLAHELEEHSAQLEAAARQRNVEEVRHQVSEVLEYCVACHQQFRDQALRQQ